MNALRLALGVLLGLLGRGSIVLPVCSLSWPSVTTISPGLTPLVIAVVLPWVSAIVTGRASTVWSLFTA